MLGDRPIPEVIEHARLFVGALTEVRGSVIDLGSGGGVPGLVIAFDRPDLRLTLVDRRRKRADLLERIVRRLGWSDAVEVVADDADDVVARRPASFDAATARGFGPPDETVRVAADLVVRGGIIVVSEPPGGPGQVRRWPTRLLEDLGLDRVPSDHRVAVFRRR
jgi:16S rRNA (guanine527-N7)-methyltransferase